MSYPDSELIDMIVSDEGYSATMYIDSEGLRTIGIGFCLDRMPMPRDVADYWCKSILEYRFNQIIKDQEHGSIFSTLNSSRQNAVLNMSYQLGITGLFEFKRMWAALRQEDYETAAKEALDSIWATQTRKRAHRIADVLRSGTMSAYR